MKYKLFRLSFPNGLLLGSGGAYADTIFSALCIEALQTGELQKLVDFTKKGELKISDTFPFIKEKLYITKPLIKPKRKKEEEDEGAKKIFKKLKYIPLNKLTD